MLSVKEKDKWQQRILRLAERYGPFVRFYPEGSEAGDGEPSALEGAIKDGEKATRTPEEQSAIDKARLNEQQLEQERANVTRANEAASQAQSDLDTARSDNEELKEKLTAAEAKAAEAGIKDVELDESQYEGTDLALVRAIKSLNDKVKAKDNRIAGLEKKAAGYESQNLKDKADAARSSAYEELLGDLDNEYGADCRNDAIERFNALIAKGEVRKGNTAKATRLMEKCYKDAKSDKSKDSSKKKESSLPLDSGSGGGNTPNLSGVEIKEGSLDEVTAQYAAATKK